MNSTISVIIPVYNVEQYLRECLDSVINQTFKNIEIICVEDCSTDNSLKILEEYTEKDSRIKLIKRKENKGLGPARNLGMEQASGDYIIFLDSDDYLSDNDILENLYNKIIETNTDFVTINYPNWIDELSEKVFDSPKTITVNMKNLRKVMINFCVIAWGKLFRTAFLKEKNLKFIETRDIHEDDGFTIKLLSTFPTYTCISQCGYFYRQNPNSIIHTKSRQSTKIALKNNLADCIQYIKTNCADSDKLIKIILYTSKYAKYHSLYGKLFKYNWSKYDKHIVFCGVELYKQKIGNNEIITKFLGIKISSKSLPKL